MMVSQNQVRSVALFFFYALLDERMALPVAGRAVASLKPKLAKLAEESLEARQILITTCVRIFQKENKRQDRRDQAAFTFNGALRLPNGVEAKSWLRFHKEASEEELIAVILQRVLGFSEHDIAEALQVSDGTIRYRVGHAVRRLGEIERGMHRGAV